MKENNQLLDNTKSLISKDFELTTDSSDITTEEELLQILADRMDEMLQHQIEYLFSMMYRLDIDEDKVHFALSPIAPEAANIGLAKLILDRQKQRAYTKMHYKQEKIDDDLAW